MFDVVGLGSIAMDVFMHVNALPNEDGFSFIYKTNYLPGGSGTNVIAQLTRLGGKCGFMAQIGDDLIGIKIKQSMAEDNIDTEGLRIIPGEVSLHCNIIVDPKGRKFILMDVGSTYLNWSAEDVNIDYLTKANIFYTDLTPVLPAIKALKEAKRAGITTVFNLQMEPKVMQEMGASKEMILDALEYTDIFTSSFVGFKDLCSAHTLNECEKYIRRYFKKLLLCTLGKKGSIAFVGDGDIVSVPALDVHAIDTTSAGDSYLGAFMFEYLLKNRPLRDSMQFASACAAYTCERVGARSQPNYDQGLEMQKKFIAQED